ncbi:hypothetical protein ACFRFH_14495 [Leifsonia sp. NPDC056824]|uniref:hypothetical protein n=1 Tax=Leifsonia sp. NPDC056824 TaxID=3345953 RepID=UPI0036966F77
MSELTVAQTAKRLGIGERQVRNLVAHAGAFTARQLASGEWLIDTDSIARFELRRRAAGRPLRPDTAWALLYELSGVDSATLLSKSTYWRAENRIRDLSPVELAIAVGGRTIAHRYRSANTVKAQADLVPTGRAASDRIGSDLLPDDRRVRGYLPAGVSRFDYARTHFMVEDPSGQDLLYENTAPGGLTAPLPAVVAADLALSTDTRERSAGLAALGALKDQWLHEHTR